ncbi:hypothetical protein [Nocardia asiatica]|uniref:hypothetical protein n=1 Tax=Nocardia asiatica TaxID=209252 RepID=UPI0002EF2B86|nr:hypothetical protein [Nocardia asiatica]
MKLPQLADYLPAAEAAALTTETEQRLRRRLDAAAARARAATAVTSSGSAAAGSATDPAPEHRPSRTVRALIAADLRKLCRHRIHRQAS